RCRANLGGRDVDGGVRDRPTGGADRTGTARRLGLGSAAAGRFTGGEVIGMGDSATAWVDLYWLPLGAGGRFVRRNGRAYEWLMSRREHRAAQDLYHCGLMVCSDEILHAVEM